MKKLLLTLSMLFTISSYAQENNIGVSEVPFITLNNGEKMPQFGLGTFAASPDDTKQAVAVALKNGYRHFDTAHAYNNENAVGTAINESGIPREEIWVTSKLWPTEYGEGVTLAAIDKMLERMQLEYIDLIYLHQPIRDFRGAWRDLEKAYKTGKVRSLGISNFDANDEVYSAIVDSMEIKPAIHQIECHPYAQRKEIRAKNDKYNIITECWFPLGHGDKTLLSDPVIGKIAEAHNKSIVQIILRWHIQEGFSVIPGATNPDYIKENIAIFDFELSDDEMQTMRSLNKEKRFYVSSLEQLERLISRFPTN